MLLIWNKLVVWIKALPWVAKILVLLKKPRQSEEKTKITLGPDCDEMKLGANTWARLRREGDKLEFEVRTGSTDKGNIVCGLPQAEPEKIRPKKGAYKA